MTKEELRANLVDIRKKILALPAQFSLQSGKVFTYEVKDRWSEGKIIEVRRCYLDGEKWDMSNGIDLTPDGNVRYFSFHSFSGRNDSDAEEAQGRNDWNEKKAIAWLVADGLRSEAEKKEGEE